MKSEIKDYMKTRCESGYEYYETTFEELALLLEENAAYTPFKFKNGYRSNSTVYGEAKFVVLDIDDCKLTDKEAHLLLEDYNHHIARTSDNDNAYKFRILLELDSPVDIEHNLWKEFINQIGEYLGFKIDCLPKSSIFFSFSGRTIYSQLGASSLPVKLLLDKAVANIKIKNKLPKKLSNTQKSLLLDDPITTFEFAYTAKKGNRSVAIYRALMYAIDLGADVKYVTNLAYEIGDYVIPPMDINRLENTIINPIVKKM